MRRTEQSVQQTSRTSGLCSFAGAHVSWLTNFTRVPQARHDSAIRNIPAGRVWVLKISRLLMKSV